MRLPWMLGLLSLDPSAFLTLVLTSLQQKVLEMIAQASVSTDPNPWFSTMARTLLMDRSGFLATSLVASSTSPDPRSDSAAMAKILELPSTAFLLRMQRSGILLGHLEDLLR